MEHARDELPLHDERKLIALLPPPLRRDVWRALASQTVERFPIFSAAAPEVALEIAQALTPTLVPAGEYVVLQGEVGEEMYLLRNGCVNIVNADGFAFKALHSGSFFGEISILTGTRRSGISIFAQIAC